MNDLYSAVVVRGDEIVHVLRAGVSYEEAERECEAAEVVILPPVQTAELLATQAAASTQ